MQDMGAWDFSSEELAEARDRKQAAVEKIEVGATYRHRDARKRYGKWDRQDIVVTHVNPATGYVSWRSASGPGLADIHRQMYCTDFVEVYMPVKGLPC